MSERNAPSCVVSEFVMLIAESWANRLPDVTAALTMRGVEVRLIVVGTRTVAGVVESRKIGEVSRLPFVEGCIEGARHSSAASGTDWLEGPAPDDPGSPGRRQWGLLGVRLAYGLLVAIGIILIARAAMGVPGLGRAASINQAVCGFLLVTMAAVSVCNLSWSRVTCHTCTCIGLWLMIAPGVLPASSLCFDMVLGLIVFLTAGCAADALLDSSDPAEQRCGITTGCAR